MTPIPIVMEAWKGKKGKCFLSVPRNPWEKKENVSFLPPVIHEPSNIPHTQTCCRRTTPVYYGRRHYVTDEQCNHTPANMIIHCRGNNYTMVLVNYILKTFLRRFPCGCKLKINNLYFYYCVTLRGTSEYRQK